MNDLELRINQLEALQAQQTEEIKEKFRELTNSLSPANLLKSALNTLVSKPGMRSTVIDSAISGGAGLLGKKLVVQGSGNILRKVAGTAVQFILSNFVRNKIPEVKEKMTASHNGVNEIGH